MATEKAPAYQWFVKDYRSSRSTMRMSFTERGVYREMLDQQWEDMTLPDDPQAVADLIAGTDAQAADVLAAWPVVRRKFVAIEDQPGRMLNVRLEATRKALKRYVKGAQKGGRARAAAAVRSASGAFQPSTSGSPAAFQPPASPISSPAPSQQPGQSSTASASAIASATASASAKERTSRAAGAPPLNLGLRRFKVWRWMLDDCIASLGDHAEAFGLDAWLQALDAKETRVIPDVWPWLKNEMLAEARRRGLATVESSDRKPLFSQTTEEMGAAVLANLNREPRLPR